MPENCRCDIAENAHMCLQDLDLLGFHVLIPPDHAHQEWPLVTMLARPKYPEIQSSCGCQTLPRPLGMPERGTAERLIGGVPLSLSLGIRDDGTRQKMAFASDGTPSSNDAGAA